MREFPPPPPQKKKKRKGEKGEEGPTCVAGGPLKSASPMDLAILELAGIRCAVRVRL